MWILRRRHDKYFDLSTNIRELAQNSHYGNRNKVGKTLRPEFCLLTMKQQLEEKMSKGRFLCTPCQNKETSTGAMIYLAYERTKAFSNYDFK